MTEPRQPDVLSRLPIPEEVRGDVMEMLRVGLSAVWGRHVLSRRVEGKLYWWSRQRAV